MLNPNPIDITKWLQHAQVQSTQETGANLWGNLPAGPFDLQQHKEQLVPECNPRAGPGGQAEAG